MNIITKLKAAFIRNPLGLITSIFLTYSALWTILDPVISLGNFTKVMGASKYYILVILSVIVGVMMRIPKTEIMIPIKNVNTKVKIIFGDLFKQDGHKIISVNEFFDSEIGNLVSEKSLHGFFIKKYLAGQSKMFDELTDKSLSNEKFDITQRDRGRTKKYPIGTTAVVNINEVKYFLVALTKTNLDTLKSEADVPELWQALSRLWEYVRIHANSCPVNIPLIGSGAAQIGIPPEQILRMIIMSITQKAKANEITSEIRIVLSPDRFDDIGLESLRKEWS